MLKKKIKVFVHIKSFPKVKSKKYSRLVVLAKWSTLSIAEEKKLQTINNHTTVIKFVLFSEFCQGIIEKTQKGFFDTSMTKTLVSSLTLQQ